MCIMDRRTNGQCLCNRAPDGRTDGTLYLLVFFTLYLYWSFYTLSLLVCFTLYLFKSFLRSISLSLLYALSLLVFFTLYFFKSFLRSISIGLFYALSIGLFTLYLYWSYLRSISIGLCTLYLLVRRTDMFLANVCEIEPQIANFTDTWQPCTR